MKNVEINNKNQDEEYISKYQILPISTFLAVLGSFFTVASIAYVITAKYCTSIEAKEVWLTIEGSILFVSLLLTFLIIGIKNYRRFSAVKAYNDSNLCLNCIKSKMQDGFHNHGLLHLDELIGFESKLALSENPDICKVLVYTSDLATEKNAEGEVKKNIESGVQYIVLYFANNCSLEEYQRIENLYGKHSLVDLSSMAECEKSFDGQLAKTIGFDIMVYKSGDDQIRGFFAVDFIPEEKPFRGCHDPNCLNKCNYGKENSIPFYKEMSFDIAKQIFYEGMELQKESLGEK